MANSKRNGSSRERPLVEEMLRLIWREHRTNRAEIARQLNLSRSTVSEIVDTLLATKMVAEKGVGRSSGGRRPIVLEFQDDSHFLLGVDLGARHVAVALTDLRGKVLCWQDREHPVRTDPDGTRSLVLELCDRCLESQPKGKSRLARIGVAVPSPVDPLHPKMLSEVVIPAWQGRSGLELLQDRFGVPVHVDNDANLGALAEQMWGAGRDVRDFVYIKIGTGIGAGYILDGNIYRGAGGFAGEMGHLPIDPNGERCVCGLKGCLATLVGAQALAKRATALLKDYPNSVLAGESPTIRAIEDAALAGDDLALRIVSEVADHLSVALSGWFNLMNPELAVLGGGLARLGDLLIDPLMERVHHSTLVSSAAAEIRTSELGPQAVAVGAATLALNAVLANPTLNSLDSVLEAT
ncbi:ROK family protein [candidate division GN15 bacterium]|nr:ROK family protein [candidate division GN15 bacterium]